MPIYQYTATDYSGGKRTGIVDARNQNIAVTLLKNQGLFVISLTEKKTSIIEEMLNFGGVPFTEIVAFTRQFSTMISAGLPLSRALGVLAEQSPNRKFRGVILESLRAVEGGSSVSEAFGKHPEVFSGTYISLVKAGESSGKLDEILKRLATTMEASRDLDNKFKAAMIYPSIVFVAMIGVFILLMLMVVPKLAQMYKSMNVELPFETRAMIAISDFFVNNLLLIGVGGVVGFLLLRYFMKSTTGQAVVSKISFSIPVFGKINHHKEITQMTRTLSLLLSSAIPIVESLTIVSKVVNNAALRDHLLAAGKNVEKGSSLSDYFKREEKIFPPLLGQMVSVGEETGQMDNVLDRVADFYDGETDNAVKGLSAALEPIILIMLGGMVGLLIVSIITPIYKITSNLQ